MSQEFLNDLQSMPRFRKGDIVIVNGINFEIQRVAGRYMELVCVQPEADKWRAFGEGIVGQLAENGLLPLTTETKSETGH